MLIRYIYIHNMYLNVSCLYIPKSPYTSSIYYLLTYLLHNWIIQYDKWDNCKWGQLLHGQQITITSNSKHLRYVWVISGSFSKIWYLHQLGLIPKICVRSANLKWIWANSVIDNPSIVWFSYNFLNEGIFKSPCGFIGSFNMMTTYSYWWHIFHV